MHVCVVMYTRYTALLRCQHSDMLASDMLVSPVDSDSIAFVFALNICLGSKSVSLYMAICCFILLDTKDKFIDHCKPTPCLGATGRTVIQYCYAESCGCELCGWYALLRSGNAAGVYALQLSKCPQVHVYIYRNFLVQQLMFSYHTNASMQLL